MIHEAAAETKEENERLELEVEIEMGCPAELQKKVIERIMNIIDEVNELRPNFRIRTKLKMRS